MRAYQIPKESYPAPPWTLSGKSWLGIFKTDKPVPIPAEYKYLIFTRYIHIAVIRYLSGTLTYDEIIIGSLVRYKWRMALYVHNIWVDSIPSLWGGRELWGLNKELAHFDWQDDMVTAQDDQGLIGRFRVNLNDAIMPAISFPIFSFGQIGHQKLLTKANLKTSLGAAGIEILEWPARYNFNVKSKPLFSIAGKPFTMIFNPAIKLD